MTVGAGTVVTTDFAGQIQVQPRLVRVNDNVSTYAQVTTAGYLNSLQGGNIDQIKPTDFIFVSYNGGFGIFNPSFSGQTITLVNAGLTQSISVTLSPAQIIAMYATPQLLIAAPGAGKAAFIQNVWGNFIYGTAAFTGGGVSVIQYGATAHGAGTTALAAANLGAAGLITGTSNVFVAQAGYNVAASGSGTASSGVINTGIYISNQTNSFAAGTGCSLVLNINYIVLPLS